MPLKDTARSWSLYHYFFDDQAMLESDYFIPIAMSVVTALLLGGLYLFMAFFRDGDDD